MVCDNSQILDKAKGDSVMSEVIVMVSSGLQPKAEPAAPA